MRQRFCGALAIAGAAALMIGPAQAVTYFSASLNAAQVPPTANGGRGSQSPGFGWVNVALADDEQSLTYTTSVQNILIPTGEPNAGQPDTVRAAHFHVGAPGIEGPVRRTIIAGVNLDIVSPQTFSGAWSATDDPQPFTAEDLNNLKTGNLYVNFHSVLYPGGVIRGQLTPGAIPEPGSIALLGSSLLPLAGFALRRRRR